MTRTGQDQAIRPEAGRGDAPPRLETYLVKRLKALLLMNSPVLLVLAGVGYWVAHDPQTKFRIDGKPLLAAVGLILLCLAVVGASAWVLLPVGRWLKAYPLWCYQHRSRFLWALPAVAGQIVYHGLRLLCLLLILTATGVVVRSLWELGRRAFGAEERTPARSGYQRAYDGRSVPAGPGHGLEPGQDWTPATSTVRRR